MKNKSKKIKVGVISLVIIIITLGISDSIGYGDPFSWEETWWVWVLCVSAIYFVTKKYKIFKDKE